MNGPLAKRYLILGLISLVLSLAIVRWHTTNNVSFCYQTPGCQNNDPRGAITEKTYGFPLAYKKTTSFRPTNDDPKKADYAGYTQTSIENQSFSIPSVLVSTLFWFGLLHLLASLLWRRKAARATASIGVDTPDTVPRASAK